MSNEELKSLYIQYFKPMVGMVMRILKGGGGKEQAEDIVNDAFLAIADKPLGRDVHRWIVTIIMNLLRDHLKHVKRKTSHHERIIEMLPKSTEPITDIDKTKAELIEKMLCSLPKKMRQIVIMKYIEKKRAIDIAATIGIKTDSVHIQTSRARDILRKAFIHQYKSILT